MACSGQSSIEAGEGNRAGQLTKLSVDLGLGGSRTDGAPGDAVCNELRRDGVQEPVQLKSVFLRPGDKRNNRKSALDCGGQTDLCDFEQEASGETKALVNVVGSVELRIVDETFPADGGSRLFELCAEHSAASHHGPRLNGSKPT